MVKEEVNEKVKAEVKAKPSAVEGTTAVHWLTRVAERAGLDGERPSVPPETDAKEAWRVVTRAYKIEDSRLSELVAAYFRLEVADFKKSDPNAPLMVPEALARRHHVFPLYETDRRLLVATCDPTQVEAERALGFSTGKTTVFHVASPSEIQEILDERFFRLSRLSNPSLTTSMSMVWTRTMSDSWKRWAPSPSLRKTLPRHRS